jgi:hypothetical protein
VVIRRLATELADHLGLSDPSRPSAIGPDEEIVFHPALGRRNTGTGAVTVRIQGWIGQPERGSLKRRAFLAALSRFLGLDDPARFDAQAGAIFRERAGPFLADNERAKRVGISIQGRAFTLPRSAANGLFAAEIALPPGVVPADARTVGFHAVLPAGDPRRFVGVARILPEEGTSIITDIDDTVRISGVHDRGLLLRRTFTEPFAPVPGMPGLLKRVAPGPDAAVHYLSAAPWQLFGPIAGFLAGHGFPEGSIHLRAIRFKDRSVLHLFREPVEHKLAVARRLIAAWPKRRFILVGDSGERDPEIYAAIAREHPGRIAHVYIRDVTGEPMTAPRYRRTLWVAMGDRWTLFTDPAAVAAR